jgi:hypothetical protein
MIDKVCVRIPAHRREELMAIAKDWREAEADRSPGWDAKAMHSVIKNNFNGLEDFFKKNGWPERGSQMMQKVQTHVKNRFGSIEAFVNLYEK